jgi:hypothetical protein
MGFFKLAQLAQLAGKKRPPGRPKKKNLVLEDQTVMLAHAEQIRLEQLSS